MADPAPTFDVFLSYQRGDEAWVVGLADALRAKGLTVWRDREQIGPGDRWVSTLEKGLRVSRCVVFVISPGSMQSRWVSEEYSLAMSLANSVGRELRLIPLLIADAELPGFMSTREHVDFRDAARFADRVQELVFGITGSGPRPAPDLRPEPETSEAEVAYLERAIERERKTGGGLRRAQVCSPLPGLVLAGLLAFVFGEPSPMWIAIAIGLPLGTGLTVWGLTVKSFARCEENVKRFESLLDGLELCRQRSNPGCTRLRTLFWDTVEQRVGSPRA